MAENNNEAVPIQVDANGIHLRDIMFMFLSRYVEGGQEVSDEERAVYLPQLERLADDPDWSTIIVYWHHFAAFDEAASLVLEATYVRTVPFLNEGLEQVMTQHYAQRYAERGKCFPCVAFSEVPRNFTVRTLRASMVGQLCAISGTVTRTSQVRPELLVGVFLCNDCGTESDPIEQQFRYTEPPACRNEGCENKNKYTLVAEHRSTRFGDWQKIRVQENANQIPVGCMPRTMDVIARNDAVEAAKPGDRVLITGYPIVVPEVSKLFNVMNRREVQRSLTGVQRAMMEDTQLANMEGATGLKALGVRDLNYRMCFLATTIADSQGDDRKMTQAVRGGKEGAADTEIVHVTTAEKQKIFHMRRNGNILLSMARCIAPNIFRHDLVKTGLLLQMLGGVSKKTMEGMALRGDINACIIGDPSTAKSQFLKWVANAVPRGIYTSGKASSAAGLTATITRDSDTGERTIEAGALMLADHGVCCIDEFDKMDIKDQVAIHEAMEQQTISIAKAGIKATLNARTSLLAALNPVGGRYDRRKPLQKNITMTAPIMSRFDLMFCIVDESNQDSDHQIADRMLWMHRDASVVDPPFTTEDFLLYLRFARTLKPRLTPEANAIIVKAYCEMRMQDSLSNRNKVYRVTTRLLESMIRLSEATAKLFLADSVDPFHVNIALEVMKASLTTVEMTEVELVGIDEATNAAAAAGEGAGGTEGAAAPGGAEGEEDTSPKADDKRAKKKKKEEKPKAKKLTITADHYHRILNKVTAHLHNLSKHEEYLTAPQVVTWYLGELPTTVVTQLEQEKRVVELVIDKLVKEGKLLKINPSEGEDDTAEPVLHLHPDFNPDVTAH